MDLVSLKHQLVFHALVSAEESLEAFVTQHPFIPEGEGERHLLQRRWQDATVQSLRTLQQGIVERRASGERSKNEAIEKSLLDETESLVLGGLAAVEDLSHMALITHVLIPCVWERLTDQAEPLSSQSPSLQWAYACQYQRHREREAAHASLLASHQAMVQAESAVFSASTSFMQHTQGILGTQESLQNARPAQGRECAGLEFAGPQDILLVEQSQQDLRSMLLRFAIVNSEEKSDLVQRTVLDILDALSEKMVFLSNLLLSSPLNFPCVIRLNALFLLEKRIRSLALNSAASEIVGIFVLPLLGSLFDNILSGEEGLSREETERLQSCCDTLQGAIENRQKIKRQTHQLKDVFEGATSLFIKDTMALQEEIQRQDEEKKRQRAAESLLSLCHPDAEKAEALLMPPPLTAVVRRSRKRSWERPVNAEAARKSAQEESERRTHLQALWHERQAWADIPAFPSFPLCQDLQKARQNIQESQDTASSLAAILCATRDFLEACHAHLSPIIMVSTGAEQERGKAAQSWVKMAQYLSLSQATCRQLLGLLIPWMDEVMMRHQATPFCHPPEGLLMALEEAKMSAEETDIAYHHAEQAYERTEEACQSLREARRVYERQESSHRQSTSQRYTQQECFRKKRVLATNVLMRKAWAIVQKDLPSPRDNLAEGEATFLMGLAEAAYPLPAFVRQKARTFRDFCQNTWNTLQESYGDIQEKSHHTPYHWHRAVQEVFELLEERLSAFLMHLHSLQEAVETYAQHEETISLALQCSMTWIVAAQNMMDSHETSSNKESMLLNVLRIILPLAVKALEGKRFSEVLRKDMTSIFSRLHQYRRDENEANDQRITALIASRQHSRFSPLFSTQIEEAQRAHVQSQDKKTAANIARQLAQEEWERCSQSFFIPFEHMLGRRLMGNAPAPLIPLLEGPVRENPQTVPEDNADLSHR